MRRRTWLTLMLFATACRRRPPEADALLPAEVAGGWRRRELHELAPESIPVETARSSVRRVYEAVYEGPAMLQVDLFEMASPTACLDLAQRWRAAAGSVFFYEGTWFVVVKWQSFDRQNLTAFVRALERRLVSLSK